MRSLLSWRSISRTRFIGPRAIALALLPLLAPALAFAQAREDVQGCLSTSLVKLNRQNTASFEKIRRLEASTQSHLRELNLDARLVAAPPYDPNARRSIPRTPRALPLATGNPSTLNPWEIRFMQESISNQALNKDYSVLQNALDLRSGKLKPSDLPAIRVWRDEFGRVWTLDHRRLAAFMLSEATDSVPVVWVGPELVRGQAFKYSTETEGRTVLLKLGRGLGVVIP